MNLINKVKTYYAYNDNWDLLDREDKSDIIMRYTDDVEELDLSKEKDDYKR